MAHTIRESNHASDGRLCYPRSSTLPIGQETPGISCLGLNALNDDMNDWPWEDWIQRIMKIARTQLYSEKLRDPADIAQSVLKSYTRQINENEVARPNSVDRAWDDIRVKLNAKLAKANRDNNKPDQRGSKVSEEGAELTATLIRSWKHSEHAQDEHERIEIMKRLVECSLEEEFHEELTARVAALYLQRVSERKIAEELEIGYGKTRGLVRKIKLHLARFRDPDTETV